jgi:hypothetical protein
MHFEPEQKQPDDLMDQATMSGMKGMGNPKPGEENMPAKP